MAYGRRKYVPKRKPFRRTRNTYKRPARKVAVPKAPRTRKTYVRRNAKAINSLSRDVKYLKMAQHGSFQMSRQICNSFKIDDSFCAAIAVDQFDIQRSMSLPDPNATPPYSANFLSSIHGTPVFKANPLLGTLDIITEFKASPGFNATSTSPGGTAMWEKMNQNIVDTGKYFCHGADYQIKVSCLAQCRSVTFTLMYSLPKGIVKHTTLSDTSYSAIMPNALRYMTRLTSRGQPGVHLPANRYKTLWSKTMFFNSLTHADGNKSNATTSNSKTFNFRINPNKIVKKLSPYPSDHNDPMVADTLLPSGVHINAYQWGAFGPNERPICDPLWLIVTTDVPSQHDPEEDSNPDVEVMSEGEIATDAHHPFDDEDVVDESCWISIARTCKWRDHQGAVL